MGAKTNSHKTLSMELRPCDPTKHSRRARFNGNDFDLNRGDLLNNSGSVAVIRSEEAGICKRRGHSDQQNTSVKNTDGDDRSGDSLGQLRL